MTKLTITREQLLEIIETDHVQCGEAPYLARMALAAMDSEPVYQVYGNNDDTWSDVDEEEMIRCRSIGEDTRTLYSAPQSPVVDSEPVAYMVRRHDEHEGTGALIHAEYLQRYHDRGEYHYTPLYRHAQQPTVAGDGRAEFETWMLKRWGRERRDDDFAMGKFIYGEDYADSYTRCVWKAWSAIRSAMLNGGKS